MKKIKSLSLLLSVAGLLLIAAAVLLQLFTPLGKSRPEFFYGQKNFDNVREIIVVTGALPVKLEYSDDSVCRVEWSSGLPLIMDCDEFGTLRITEDDSFTLSLFSQSADSAQINLYVPRRNYERISLSTSSGNITTLGVTCESLELSTRSGYMHVTGADENTKIKNESGTTYLSIGSIDGEMTVNGGKGQMVVDLSGSLDVFVEFATESGSCTSRNFYNDVENRRGDAALLGGKGGNTLKINTTAGNLEINRAPEATN